MKQQHTYVFFISLLVLLISLKGVAQEEEIPSEVQDTLQKAPISYGLRIGTDLAKLIRTGISDNYQGFEIQTDFRIKEKYYLAAELGNEKRTIGLPNLNSTSQGSYIKAGFNYNAYENWFGMNNLIFAGLRAGFSSFSQDLNSYTIYTTNPLFGDDTRLETQEFSGLNATWLEFQLGIQAELFSNVYLGVHVQLKRSITQTEPEGFENLYIPGFGKTTDGSSFSAGYGYTISYLIPLFKK